MSYNTDLQAKNTRIRSLIDKANALPDAGSGSGGDNVFEQVPSFTYAVQAISGASYGFAQNSNGYWESENKGVNKSYAACRVQFEVANACDITFDVINYAESNYDYAQFSLLDTAINLSYNPDTTVHYDFKGKQSANVVNVVYENVPVGTHFIDVKFRKDTSTHSNNDSVQFKVQDAPMVEAIRADALPRIQAAESDLVPENIISGKNILGVAGTAEVGGGGDYLETVSITVNSSNGPIAYLYYLNSNGECIEELRVSGSKTLDIVKNSIFIVKHNASGFLSSDSSTIIASIKSSTVDYHLIAKATTSFNINLTTDGGAA